MTKEQQFEPRNPEIIEKILYNCHKGILYR